MFAYQDVAQLLHCWCCQRKGNASASLFVCYLKLIVADIMEHMVQICWTVLRVQVYKRASLLQLCCFCALPADAFVEGYHSSDQVNELYKSNSSNDILQVVQGSRSFMYGCLHSVCLLLSPAFSRKALNGSLIAIM